jgi:hypothetical protein
MTDVEIFLDEMEKKLMRGVFIEKKSIFKDAYNIIAIPEERIGMREHLNVSPFGLLGFYNDEIYFIPCFGNVPSWSASLSDPKFSLDELCNFINRIAIEFKKTWNESYILGVTWSQVEPNFVNLMNKNR